MFAISLQTFYVAENAVPIFLPRTRKNTRERLRIRLKFWEHL